MTSLRIPLVNPFHTPQSSHFTRLVVLISHALAPAYFTRLFCREFDRLTGESAGVEADLVKNP